MWLASSSSGDGGWNETYGDTQQLEMKVKFSGTLILCVFVTLFVARLDWVNLNYYNNCINPTECNYYGNEHIRGWEEAEKVPFVPVIPMPSALKTRQCVSREMGIINKSRKICLW